MLEPMSFRKIHNAAETKLHNRQ